MEGRLKIGIGIESYQVLTEEKYYYVDKTLLIKELLDQKGGVKLFARPRRFGKTLTLSMLRAFFEADTDEKGRVTDNSHYFAGRRILGAGEAYTRHMGQYPVISLTLKSARQPEYGMAYACLKDEIGKEFERHCYLLSGDALLDMQKEKYLRIMGRKADAQEYATALRFLCECLKRYHGKNTILLLDEYDVPLENAWFEDFYEPMAKFVRSLFESALKTNDCLEFAVVTGCLRISRESIFTGLNNLEVISMLSEEYAEYFGFTQQEVEGMLLAFGRGEKIQEVKQWYNGYLFGSTEVYNPWSVVNYVKASAANREAFPRPYWSNTSSNSIVRELVEGADEQVKEEIEELIRWGEIEKPVREEVTYGEIHKSQENLWSFLFFTGYLKAVGQRMEGNTLYLTLRLPNEEVRYIYEHTIREWFEERLKAVDFGPFYQALLSGDCEAVEQSLREQLEESISYMDSGEGFYHGFLLGLLGGLPHYRKLSNRESGAGRPDLMLKPHDERKPVVILELKRTDKFSLMEEGCRMALDQIREKDYAADPLEEGYTRILSYGICFCKKSCKVRCAGGGECTQGGG